MANSIQYWKDRIIEQKTLQTELSSLNNTSKSAIYQLWAYLTAVVFSIYDQLIDVFKTDVEQRVGKTHVGTKKYLYDKVINFQYGDNILLNTNINDVNFGNFYYDVVDSTKKIITRCSITSPSNKYVVLKVAKGSTTLSGLTNDELIALKSTIYTMFPAGIQYNLISGNADKIFIECDVRVQSNVNTTTIKQTVIDAINNFLKTNANEQNFDGIFYLSELDFAIRSVSGVRNVEWKNISIRTDLQTISEGIKVVDNRNIINFDYNSRVGYLTEETTALNTFTDKINIII